eukprot:CAMPEP_0178425784 /NCGR_PEP_ID=MMETSP0689_2-20121128/28898_1 /TAXON_ID=160604 /ORGANISM="Amphidinium massartii, Strain CS-259" /LENGTH=99 /DNA_ID=CAMNT_0020047451 /DNA_START=304 /DNA_END=602 /DNA_ORIENTATION=+
MRSQHQPLGKLRLAAIPPPFVLPLTEKDARQGSAEAAAASLLRMGQKEPASPRLRSWPRRQRSHSTLRALAQAHLLPSKALPDSARSELSVRDDPLHVH